MFFVTETFFKAADLVEKNVLSYITALAMQLDLDNIVFPNQKQLKEKYMSSIFELTQNFFNANLHRRNYKTKEKQELKKFRRECAKDPNKHLDIYKNPTELWIELNGFLTSLKAALDSLAVSLNPVLGLNINGWHKEKDPADGKEKSGINVIKTMQRNTSKKLQHIIDPLVVMIEKEIDWITYLVLLRDDPVHKGGLKNVSKLKYVQKTHNTTGQIITHADGSQEPVEAFMRRAIDAMIDFSKKLIIGSIYTRTPGLILATIIQGNGDVQYTWVPEHIAQQTKERNSGS